MEYKVLNTGQQKWEGICHNNCLWMFMPQVWHLINLIYYMYFYLKATTVNPEIDASMLWKKYVDEVSVDEASQHRHSGHRDAAA
jgi:hypothetical protein